MKAENFKNVLVFNDSSELVTILDKCEKFSSKAVTRNNDGDWINYTWQETMTDFYDGYDVEAMAYEKKSLDSLIESEQTKTNIQYDVTGDYLDVGAFMQGTPECFASMELLPSDKPELNIYASVSVSAGISPEIIKTRGVAIASLIEQLKHDYFVNLWFEFASNYNHGHYYKFKVPVENVTSFNQLAFYAAHAGMLRRFCLAIMEYTENNKKIYGYGEPLSVDHNEPSSIVFKSLTGRISDFPEWSGLEAAKNEVMRIIKELKEKGLKNDKEN